MKKNHRIIFFLITLSSISTETVQAVTDNPDRVRYELATVIREMMFSSQPNWLSFKYFVHDLKFVSSTSVTHGLIPLRLMSFPKIYRGEMPIYFNGHPFLSENMENNYNWSVYVGGPMAFPELVSITSPETTGYERNLDENYFLKFGLQADTLMCAGYSPANSSVWYKIKSPGKQPIYLNVFTSTGSGGTTYTFQISMDPVSISDAVDLSQVGREFYNVQLGSCTFPK